MPIRSGGHGKVGGGERNGVERGISRVSIAEETVALTVNGRTVVTEAVAETPLLYVLRNDAGLHSVRYGCGISRCGACTVLLDGEPVRSCGISVGEVAGRSVVTVEGLGTASRLHPVQQAFLDEQAAQCGYCLSGMIMEAVALLDRTPLPTEAEIRSALDGTLCRCGAHVRIIRAIQRAAGMLATDGGPR